jgi:hypothetical protein
MGRRHIECIAEMPFTPPVRRLSLTPTAVAAFININIITILALVSFPLVSISSCYPLVV